MQGRLDWEGLGKGERGKSTRVHDSGGPDLPGFAVEQDLGDPFTTTETSGPGIRVYLKLPRCTSTQSVVGWNKISSS